MLGKAVDWKLLNRAPSLKLRPENGREATIDPPTETKLLSHMQKPCKDVFTIIQTTGLRPDEVFRMTIENINWQTKTYFNPSGQTKRSRRFVPLSDRVVSSISLRCGARKTGWVFTSKRSKSGHLVTVARQFRKARTDAGVPKAVVLYSARHTCGTFVYEQTGNLKLTMDLLGHSDVRTAMRYQHP